MGIDMPKSRKISCSNWAAKSLSMQQIKYASLDVFVAGQVSYHIDNLTILGGCNDSLLESSTLDTVHITFILLSLYAVSNFSAY